MASLNVMEYLLIRVKILLRWHFTKDTIPGLPRQTPQLFCWNVIRYLGFRKVFVAITSMYWWRIFKNAAVVGILMERICPSCCAVAMLELILTLMQGASKATDTSKPPFLFWRTHRGCNQRSMGKDWVFSLESWQISRSQIRSPWALCWWTWQSNGRAWF